MAYAALVTRMRTSSTPGRTRALNWFRIGPPRGEALHFVDLPGYGYAKVPHDMRKSWRPLVEAFAKRPTVRMFVLLIDIRRGPEQEEAELVEWLDEIGVPLLVVLTKADKLAKNRRFPEVAAAKRALDLSSPPLTFSAQDGDGVDELWRALLAAI
jgi:GTP-binding protein